LQSGTSDVGPAAGQALAAVHRHLDQCKLAPNTVKAYRVRRQTSAGRGGQTSRQPSGITSLGDLA